MTYVQTYNAENRIASIQKLASGTCAAPGNLAAKWDFTYDGDGVRTGQSYTPYTNGQPGTVEITRYFFGGAYETTGSTWKKYYSFAGQMIAMRTWDVGLGTWNLSYFLSDHLGSTSVVLDDEGTILEQQRYLPFGEARELPNYATIQLTDFTYTGQRNLPDTGLMDYDARFYSPALGRFIQPDSIIPGAANPQSWNRYSYVTNRPTNLNDPTGHRADYGESGGGSFDYKKYPCSGMRELVLAICQRGTQKVKYPKEFREGIKEIILGDAPIFVHDAWDAINNPLSGVGYGYFVPSICRIFGRNCGADQVDTAVDIVQVGVHVGSTSMAQPTPLVTPTPFNFTPTVSMTPGPPTSSLTPTLSPTSTFTQTPSATLVPTNTLTPSITPTPTISVIPSATLKWPSSTITMTPTITLTPTPVYWIP